jgi:hypothetical protein
MLIDPDPPTTMSPNNTTETDKAIEEDTMAPATKKTVVLNIAVGSGNPCKINAVKAALQQVIGSSSSVGAELNVEGFDVQSGVPDQPFGDVSQNKYGSIGRFLCGHLFLVDILWML